MKKITFIFIMIAFGINAQTNEPNKFSEQQKKNLQHIVKDSATLKEINEGVISNPAIVIGLMKGFESVVVNPHRIRIAIDPGHIATNKKEAFIEERYIKTSNGYFFESQLTAGTAYVLKQKFEDLGFEVMITRNHDQTALGHKYLHWYKKERKKFLKDDLETGMITQEKFDQLSSASAKEVFEKYYREKDFQARSQKINNFKPDVTLIIHYNASEFTNTSDKEAPKVDFNYSITFVPGGFTNNELAQDSQLEDIIRLISTDQISKSILLSSFIVSEFENKLGVEKLQPEKFSDLWYLKKYSVATSQAGVYSRNLTMTRTVESPLCYGESLLQNNKDEIERLSKKDYQIKGMFVSSRILDNAECYYSGTLKYLSSIGRYPLIK